MLSKILAQLTKCNFKTAALASLCYGLFFNISIIIFKFNYYKSDLLFGSLDLLKDFIIIFVANFILFLGLSLSRTLFLLGSLFLFITGALASYSVLFFKIFPTKQMIRTLFENEISESLEILSMKLILWVILSIVISLFILIKAPKKNKILLPVLCLIICVFNIISPRYRVLTSYFPFQYLHNYYLYYLDKFHNVEKKDISEGVDFKITSTDEIIGILVIGESARYDHFSINGYKRETNPLLKKRTNLVSFLAEADANLTYLSVPYMLSKKGKDNIENAIYETSFLSILTKLNVETSWIATQTLLKYIQGYTKENIYHEVKIAIIPGGSALYQMNDHDSVMLPYFDNIINMEGMKFVVLHTSGSHWNYSARYPKEFENFKPTCASEVKMDHTHCSKEELINIYDNSILYTDYILDQIIERIKNKNAFLIYVSDHGESLGENGVYNHGAQPIPKEQTSIPFIFWGSDKFLADRPGFLQKLKNKSASVLNHNYIFHSSLGCMGVESSMIDQKLNLCRKN